MYHYLISRADGERRDVYCMPTLCKSPRQNFSDGQELFHDGQERRKDEEEQHKVTFDEVAEPDAPSPLHDCHLEVDLFAACDERESLISVSIRAGSGSERTIVCQRVPTPGRSIPIGSLRMISVPLIEYFGERASSADSLGSRIRSGSAGSTQAGRPMPTKSVESDMTAELIPARVRKPPVTMIAGAGVGRDPAGRPTRSARAEEAKERKKASREWVRSVGLRFSGTLFVVWRALVCSLSSLSISVAEVSAAQRGKARRTGVLVRPA